tara:strand:+ start:486 stop:689 length:204 start_codon:yes stop_codon:yes gene_type:complete
MWIFSLKTWHWLASAVATGYADSAGNEAAKKLKVGRPGVYIQSLNITLKVGRSGSRKGFVALGVTKY